MIKIILPLFYPYVCISTIWVILSKVQYEELWWMCYVTKSQTWNHWGINYVNISSRTKCFASLNRKYLLPVYSLDICICVIFVLIWVLLSNADKTQEHYVYVPYMFCTCINLCLNYFQAVSYVNWLTLLLVFSRAMYFPSAAHSIMLIGPFALRWYVVFADISPFTTWLTFSEESKQSSMCTFLFTRVST